MFDGHYFDWNRKRIKGIIDFYGHKFFFYKKVLDLGCGHADLSGALFRLGSDIVIVDARQEHLKIAQKKFNGIKAVQADLDASFPFANNSFDIVLDLDLICHLNNYEKHLKAVCASTTHLILETAVMDDGDPYNCVVLQENKNIYDLSINGVSSRPTAAAIERVLTECGFNFKRMDSSIYNSNSYKYDWQSKNDKSCDIFKRRIWFAISNNSPIQFKRNPIEIPEEPPKILRAPRPPVIVGQQVIVQQPVISAAVKPVDNLPTPTVLPNQSDIITKVKLDSEKHAIFKEELFIPPVKYDIAACIFPTNNSSKMWLKKIMPLFNNISISNKVLTMRKFPQSGDAPNLVMGSINSIHAANKVWIEEWSDNLTEPQINMLKSCGEISTPSLINAQEILQHIPDAKINRVVRAWPSLPITTSKTDYFVYFEKDAELTKILLSAWRNEFGRLLIVGPTLADLPEFTNYITKYTDYENLLRSVMSAKGIIDLSKNNYYKSGILELAKSYRLPIITNNNLYLDNSNATLILQNKLVDRFVTADNITSAIFKSIISSTYNVAYNDQHNQSLYESFNKMLGVKC